MKKNTVLFLSLLFTMLLLAACNTDEQQPQNPATVEEDNANDNNEEVALAQQDQPQTVEENPTNANENSIKDSNEEKFLTFSDELNYSIQHLKQFTLGAEEPGKDMLFYKDNDALSMRIEVFAIDELSFDELQADTQQLVLAVAPEGLYETVDLAPYTEARKEVVNSDNYLVQYESDKVTTVIYELEEKLVRLTVYDDYVTDLTDTFLQMGFTIE